MSLFPGKLEGRSMKIGYLCADAGIPLFGRKGSSTHIRGLVRVERKE